MVVRAVLVLAFAASTACSYNGSFVDCEIACTQSTGCPPGFTCSPSEGLCRAADTSLSCSSILGDAGTPPSFAAKVDFPTGRAVAVAIGDLNGDGRPDLAVANSSPGTVSILLNTTPTGAATPSFATTVDFTTGQAASVALGDFNDDGRPDLAVANITAIAILLNMTPTGATTPSFAAKVDFPTAGGSSPGKVVVSDLNGDGKPDLATPVQGANVSVLLNTTLTGATTPSFATSVEFSIGSYAGQIATGDVNGDAKPDLVVANYTGGMVSVLANTTATGATTPSFAANVGFTTGSSPFSVAIGDLNGDGKPDLAVTIQGSDKVGLFLNTTVTGAPTFGAKTEFAAAKGPAGIALGDLNGDGRPDLAIANFSSTTDPTSVSVFLNTTTMGATTPSLAAKADFATGGASIAVAIGDLNQDGKSDLAVSNSGSNTVSVLLSQ